jgi:riboflavin kinase/FMN adenylyltransferase
VIETSLDHAEPAARTVALGSFDGVHLGHRRVIEAAIAAAAERGTRSSVVTFEPHPMVVLRPECRRPSGVRSWWRSWSRTS